MSFIIAAFTACGRGGGSGGGSDAAAAGNLNASLNCPDNDGDGYRFSHFEESIPWNDGFCS